MTKSTITQKNINRKIDFSFIYLIHFALRINHEDCTISEVGVGGHCPNVTLDREGKLKIIQIILIMSIFFAYLILIGFTELWRLVYRKLKATPEN